MRKVRKHRKDYNKGKQGWNGGNPRYDRRDPQHARSMRPGVKHTLRGCYRGDE